MRQDGGQAGKDLRLVEKIVVVNDCSWRPWIVDNIRK